jgi:putative membrane protein
MIELIFSYIHVLSIMVMVASLSVEIMLLASHDGSKTAENLSRADFAYFVAAGAVLLSGAIKMLMSSNGMMFYAGNPLFLLKVMLFFAAAGLSMIPSRRYAHWSSRMHMDPGYRIPAAEARSTLRLTVVELSIVATLPLLAVMMSRGVGN